MNLEEQVESALAGIRVVDMSATVMGPMASQLLGDHGADVIKVESPAGDTTRNIPPMQNPQTGCTFLQLNRNKRSVVLDLKIERHMEAMRDLLAGADVFMYSVRPQAMARLGLGPRTSPSSTPNSSRSVSSVSARAAPMPADQRTRTSSRASPPCPPCWPAQARRSPAMCPLRSTTAVRVCTLRTPS
ncbi:Formyl-CoA:oxalate CoA-transferase [Streptomyces alboniger]